MFKKKNKLSNRELLEDFRCYLSEEELLRLEIEETKLALDAAYSVWQNITEPELIDSVIYELNSIQSKYTFLTKKYREISA
ncbi:MAG: DUF2508 family protein [Lachnospiraceae bacterium]|nr:DUF2508 family protein [Lachnospiraceae bacterium]